MLKSTVLVNSVSGGPRAASRWELHRHVSDIGAGLTVGALTELSDAVRFQLNSTNDRRARDADGTFPEAFDAVTSDPQ
jgi:hypothetical protein